jgi:hypothetical protein
MYGQMGHPWMLGKIVAITIMSGNSLRLGGAATGVRAASIVDMGASQKAKLPDHSHEPGWRSAMNVTGSETRVVGFAECALRNTGLRSRTARACGGVRFRPAEPLGRSAQPLRRLHEAIDG